jgi:hypothetical protein
MMKKSEENSGKKPKVPKPIPAIGGILGGIGGAGAGLPRKTRIAELDQCIVDIKAL